MNNQGYKIILIGDSGVGKSSIVFWINNYRQIYNSPPTVGIAFTTKELIIDGKSVKFEIWDTAGQERYRSICKMCYRNSVGCFCVFDVTNRESFENLDFWVNSYISGNNVHNSIIIIIANKTDIDKSQWKVTEKEVIQFAEKNNLKCIFTTCITGDNIYEAFYTLATEIINIKIVFPETIPYYPIYLGTSSVPKKNNNCIC
jgi:small GTP-binding protein